MKQSAQDVNSPSGVNAMSVVPEDPINPEFYLNPDVWKVRGSFSTCMVDFSSTLVCRKQWYRI